MSAAGERVPWNLSVNAKLKHLVEIQAATDQENVSDITERLYRDYLKTKGVRVAEANEEIKSLSSRKPVRYSKPRRKK